MNKGPDQPLDGPRQKRFSHLAWLPIPLLLAVIIAARVAGLSESYSSETLTLVLSLCFSTLAPLGTLFLIGRSFLVLRTPGLLLLECGVLLWSLASTVGDIVSHGNANVNVTIFNTGILLAGACHLTGASLSLKPRQTLRAAPLWLGIGCVLVLGMLGLIVHAALAGWLPVFFIPGQGGTPVRYSALISAIIMFVLSAGLLLSSQRTVRTPFVSWYALALLLLAVGLFGIMIQLSLGSVVNWLSRSAQWLGGLYLLCAAAAALRESSLSPLPLENDAQPEYYKYGVAIVLTIAATGIRFAVSSILEMRAAFVTFYPAVILSALYGGWRAGLLAMAFSALIVAFFWMEPVHQFAIRSPVNWIAMGFFLVACTMIIFVVEVMHKVKARLLQYQDHLEDLVKDRTAKLEREVVERQKAEEIVRRSRDELEHRVQERTIELQKSEETAREQKREIETYYLTAPIGLCILDADLRYLKINERLAEMNGVPASEHLGRTVREVIPSFADQVEGFARQVMETGKPVTDIEVTGENPAQPGVIGTWVAAYYPLKDSQGKVVAISLVVEDVSKQRRLEEQLRQSQKMEAVGTLAGGIAHDFNNILAAIIGFTEMAIEDVPDRPDVKRSLHNVSTAAMRARDLVKQILSFSRKASPERTPLSLSPLVTETVEFLRASIPATIEINLSIYATSDTVLASPVEVQQILMNLATNASLAMQEDGGTIQVHLTDIDLRPDSPVFGPDVAPGEYVQLMVKDTGTGMTPDVMRRIFDPFFTTRGTGEGTGMGLSVVYGIVKDLRGTITVESALGMGSTFRVLIPKMKNYPEEKHRPEGPIPGGKERILFVDDEKMLVEWSKDTLGRLGYNVTALVDSREALETFSSDPLSFDLVIADHAMPQMAGAQLAEELLRIRNDIPIILYTGHSEIMSPEKALNIGIKGFLMKPLTRKELAEAIRRVLDAKPDT